MLKLGFCDFWGGFLPENNFFFHLFFDTFGDVCVVEPDKADVVIYSCFGEAHKYLNRSKTKKIFYTGENMRPRPHEADISITFDYTDQKNHIRIPLYMYYMDWFGVGSYGNPAYLTPLSDIDHSGKTNNLTGNFCAAIFNNPVQMRLDLMTELSKYKKVDGYGRPFGNHSDGEDKKMNILSKYEFSICPENSIYDGYYTEKLLHAYAAKTIPIYWADEGIARDFNTQAFINVRDFESYPALREYIEFLDKITLRPIVPLFRKPPSLDSIKKQLCQLL